MKTKPKKHIIRALMLPLCLCLLCLPLMGMAMSDNADAVSDSGEPKVVVIDIMPEEETAALYSGNRPGHGGGGNQDDPCDPKPPGPVGRGFHSAAVPQPNGLNAGAWRWV